MSILDLVPVVVAQVSALDAEMRFFGWFELNFDFNELLIKNAPKFEKRRLYFLEEYVNSRSTCKRHQ